MPLFPRIGNQECQPPPTEVGGMPYGHAWVDKGKRYPTRCVAWSREDPRRDASSVPTSRSRDYGQP